MFQVHLVSSECIQEAQRVKDAEQREQSLRNVAALERLKYLEAEKEVEIAKKLLAKETYERQMAELDVRREALEKNRILDALLSSDPRYRRYTRDDIQTATGSFDEEKVIGEGAYGKVYKCSLDHTLVAVKTLRSDAFSRKEEFLREVWPSLLLSTWFFCQFYTTNSPSYHLTAHCTNFKLHESRICYYLIADKLICSCEIRDTQTYPFFITA